MEEIVCCIVPVTSRSRLEAIVNLHASLGNDHDGVEYKPIHVVEDVVRSPEVSL